MNSTDIHPAPVLEAPTRSVDLEAPTRSIDPKWTREYEAFQRQLPGLLKRYEGQYVAIHEGQVVASGPDLVEVAQAAYDRVGYEAMHVGKVSQEPPRVYRVPSPRFPENVNRAP